MLPSILSPSEDIARFLCDEHFRKSDNTVKPRAFQPIVDKGRLVVSVFRIHGLDNIGIWRIGHDIGAVSNRTICARADIPVASIREIGLDIDPDNIPYRHANIINWPQEEGAIKQMQQELAAEAHLVRK
jgi:hypothetical protein